MTTRLPALLAAATLAAVTVAVPAALAQDWRQPPAFGAVNIPAGFMPDPYVHNVTAGGSLDAGRVLGGNCVGTIANAPDFRMHYTAGQYNLTIYAESRSDTTLVVNTPDGRWHCNDDWNDTLNPGLTFANPLSGQYDVWLGAYGGGRGIPAQILVSERY